MPRKNPSLDNLKMRISVQEYLVLDDSFVQDSSFFRDVRVAQRQFWGVNTPGFPQVKQINSYSMYNTRLGQSAWSGTVRTNNIKRKVTYPTLRAMGADFLGMAPAWHVPTLVDLNNRHISKVKSSKVNLAVAFAEAPAAIRMISESAGRIARALIAVKRGKMSRALKALGAVRRRSKPFVRGDVHGNWLAIQYGWLPLLSDIKGAAEHLARRGLKTSHTFRVVNYAKGADQGPLVTNSTFSSDFGIMGYLSSRFTRETTSRMETRWVATNDAFREASQLGFTNPMAVAWELVPYSFVVDWFYPVGQLLESYDAFSGLSFAGGFTTERTITRAFTNSVQPYSASFQSGNVTGSTEDVQFALTRTKLLSAPSFISPVVENGLDTKRALNAIALISATIKPTR